MEEIDIPTAKRIESPAQLVTPASTVFDPAGRYQLDYAEAPDKSFNHYFRLSNQCLTDFCDRFGGRNRVLFIGGSGIMFLGCMLRHPAAAAVIITVGMLMVESAVYLWGRGS